MTPKPTKSAKDKRSKPCTVRYQEGEYDLIAEVASESALEVASYIRMVSVAAAREHAAKKGGKR